MLIVVFVCITQIQGIPIESEFWKSDALERENDLGVSKINRLGRRQLSISHSVSPNTERFKRAVGATSAKQLSKGINATTVVFSIHSDPEHYVLIIVGCIIGGTIIFGACIGVLIYLKMKKTDDTVSMMSSTDDFVPKPKVHSSQTGRNHESTPVGKRKTAEREQGSADEEKKKDKKKRMTMADLVMQKRHQEYVNERMKEHAEDVKSSRFQKKKKIFIPNQIDDEAFLENGKTPEVKLDKVFYNYKENELYDSSFEIEEMDIEPQVPVPTLPSSANSMHTAPTSMKRNKTASKKDAKVQKAQTGPKEVTAGGSLSHEPNAVIHTAPPTEAPAINPTTNPPPIGPSVQQPKSEPGANEQV